MLELISYILTGLAALVVLAACFVCRDEPCMAREKLSATFVSGDAAGNSDATKPGLEEAMRA